MSKPSHNLGEKLLEGEERAAKEAWAHLHLVRQLKVASTSAFATSCVYVFLQ